MLRCRNQLGSRKIHSEKADGVRLMLRLVSGNWSKNGIGGPVTTLSIGIEFACDLHGLKLATQAQINLKAPRQSREDILPLDGPETLTPSATAFEQNSWTNDLSLDSRLQTGTVLVPSARLAKRNRSDRPGGLRAASLTLLKRSESDRLQASQQVKNGRVPASS